MEIKHKHASVEREMVARLKTDNFKHCDSEEKKNKERHEFIGEGLDIMSKLILMSKGLNRPLAKKLLKKILPFGNMDKASILLISLPEYGIDQLLIDSCLELGFMRQNIKFAREYKNTSNMTDMDYIYVGEGNTFDVLQFIHTQGLFKYIKNQVKKGTVYIGCSAGAMLGGIDLRFAHDFDKNKNNVINLKGLSLFSGTVIPHYKKSELKRYIKQTPNDLLAGYKKIYSVADNEALIMENNKVSRIKVKD